MKVLVLCNYFVLRKERWTVTDREEDARAYWAESENTCWVGEKSSEHILRQGASSRRSRYPDRDPWTPAPQQRQKKGDRQEPLLLSVYEVPAVPLIALYVRITRDMTAFVSHGARWFRRRPWPWGEDCWLPCAHGRAIWGRPRSGREWHQGAAGSRIERHGD